MVVEVITPLSANFTLEKYKNIELACYDVVGSVVYSKLCHGVNWDSSSVHE